MKGILAVVPLFGLAVAAAASGPAPGVIEGRWTNPKQSVVVAVDRCGRAWCGTVVAASAKAEASARKGGTTSLVGTRILNNLKPDGAGGYRGRVFLPKRNIHAAARVRTLGQDTMLVTGCALGGLVCDEQRWTRARGQLAGGGTKTGG